MNVEAQISALSFYCECGEKFFLISCMEEKVRGAHRNQSYGTTVSWASKQSHFANPLLQQVKAKAFSLKYLRVLTCKC